MKKTEYRKIKFNLVLRKITDLNWNLTFLFYAFINLQSKTKENLKVLVSLRFFKSKAKNKNIKNKSSDQGLIFY